MTARASSAAADKPRLLLVVNSYASGMSAELRDRAVSVLGRTYAVGIVDSASPSQSTEASRRAAAEGVAVVAVLGGDGAARSVAEGIAHTDTALCCLPAGSRNVFARMLDAPPGPVAAAERLAEGVVRERRVDLGTIAGRPFLFAASVGLSARVNEELNRRPKLKAGLGAAYGAVTALRTGLAYLVLPPRMRLSVGERKLEAVSLIVQNARPLTYVGGRPLELCESVSLTSGTVSIAALARLVPSDLATIPVRLALRATEPATAHRHVEEVAGVVRATVAALGARGLPLDLDGDHAGSFRGLEIGVAPGALAVIG